MPIEENSEEIESRVLESMEEKKKKRKRRRKKRMPLSGKEVFKLKELKEKREKGKK